MKKIIDSIKNSIKKHYDTPAKPLGTYYGNEDYSEYIVRNSPSADELAQQKEYRMQKMPVISIIVVYAKTDRKLLNQTIESILSQTYQRCEICICALPELDGIDDLTRMPNVLVAVSSGDKSEQIKAAISIATGEFVMFVGVGDTLQPNAIFEIVKAMNEQPMADAVYTDNDYLLNGIRTLPMLKPDYSFYTLLSYNYIGKGLAVKKELYDKVGGIPSLSAEGEYDLILRVARKAVYIEHVSKILYTAYSEPTHVDIMRGRSLINQNIAASKERGYAVGGIYNGSFHVHYQFKQNAVDVCIIVISDGNIAELRRCLESIEDNTTFGKYSIIVANDDTSNVEFRRYCNVLKNNRAATIVDFDAMSGYSKMCNDCAEKTNAQILVFMLSSVEVLSPDWLETMVEQCTRDDVGMVGPKICFPDGNIANAGTVIGVGGWWKSAYYECKENYSDERMNRFINTQREVSALSSYCVVISAEKLNGVGGFDETIKGEASVIELCIRLNRKNLRNIYTPFAKLCAYKRSTDLPTPQDEVRCYDMCRHILKNGDPCFNPNYDYATAVPTLAVESYPAIELNPVFAKVEPPKL